MSGTVFAPRSYLHLALGLAGLLAPALLAPSRGDQPASVLSAEQKQKLQERDRLAAQANQLQRRGNLVEAIATAQTMLAIESQVFGDVHEDVASSLEWLAGMYEQREDFTAARQARQQVLAIRIKLHGEKHWKTTNARLALADVEYRSALTPDQRRRLAEARRLTQEVLLLYRRGRSPEAVERARRALEINKQLLGEKHPECAVNLNNLAQLYDSMGDYANAEPLYRQALQIFKQALGEMHPHYASSLHNLAALYDSMGDYARAEPLHRQTLKIKKQVLGEKDASYATSLNSLALLYKSRGHYAKAEPLLRQALQIRKEVLGEKHPEYANSLHNLAALYESMGEYALAEPLYRQALEITKQARGEQHPHYAASLHSLAWLYQSMGDYARAEPLLRQALQIKKRALGEKHPQYAVSLNNLALLYHSAGDYAKAEPLLCQALQITRKVLGEKHPGYIASLHNLGGLYRSMGDYARAEPLLRQALQLREEVLGEQHSAYATSLDSLALLYQDMRDYAQAEPLYRQALQIKKRALGEKHPSYAVSLNNLALLYDSMGDNSQAEPLYREALQINKQVLGELHPRYANSLNNLALLYKGMGDYARAEPLYREALEINKQVLGKKHPLYGNSLCNLACLYWSEAAGLQLLTPATAPLHGLTALCGSAADAAQAQSLLRLAVEVSRANLDLAAAVQSQRQQLEMLQQLRFGLDGYLSLAPPTQRDVTAQYQLVLAWKGAVGRRQRLQRLARQRPGLADDFTALDRLSAHLAALSLATPDPRRLPERRQQIQALTEQRERLEADLAGKSAAFRTGRELQHLEPAQLQAVLPADALLLDFLEYVHHSPAPWKKGGWQRERRLVAFVVRQDGLTRVDLGPTQPITETVQRWRLALQRRFRTEGDAQLGVAVRQLLWQPLEPHLKGARVVLVSPDDALARVPFAALPGRTKDSYLVEEMALAVVPVPQLLPELLAPGPDARKTQSSLLLVGDVRYDSAPGGEGFGDSRAAPRGGALLHWPALQATGVEVAEVGRSFQGAFRQPTLTALRQGEATEAAVRQLAPTHRFLHFATHGYFAPKELRSALALVSHGRDTDTANLFQRQDIAGFHPGLLSGLVLAGANRPLDIEKDDGILTALEVEALDLSGVELATLSACETGLGESAGGEGLLGLQRAFQMAGARSTVAGLWQVDDTATRKLMVEFYSNLWEKKLPKLEALRQAQLWMLREGESWMLKEGLTRGMVDVRVPKERLPVEDGRLAPYYWAAFSLSGDWR